MMRKSWIVAAAIVLVLGAAVAWDLMSPAMTLRSMAAAAKAKDSERFSSYVDYPALKKDMKAEFTARLKSEAAKDGSPGAKMGLAMGLAIMGPMVDAMVSPEGMNAAFAKIADAKAVWSKGSGEARKPEIERVGLNRFLVGSKDSPGSGFVFERRGLGWKLVGIDLPKDRAQAPQPR